MEVHLKQLHDRYDLYKRKFLHKEWLFLLSRDETTALRLQIRDGLRRVSSLWHEGRQLKTANMWTADFEQAIERFRTGYNELVGLEPQIEDLYQRYYARRSQMVLCAIGIVAAFIIAAMFAA